VGICGIWIDLPSYPLSISYLKSVSCVELCSIAEWKREAHAKSTALSTKLNNKKEV